MSDDPPRMTEVEALRQANERHAVMQRLMAEMHREISLRLSAIWGDPEGLGPGVPVPCAVCYGEDYRKLLTEDEINICWGAVMRQFGTAVAEEFPSEAWQHYDCLR